jgi:hypothetical protein
MKAKEADLLRFSSRLPAVVLLASGLLCLAACQRQKREAGAPPSPIEGQSPRESAAQVPESRQRQWDHLNRIRQNDNLNSSIARTLLNDQNQLGVVLYSSVTLDKVPALMRTVMTEMAQEFPHEDVTLVVYAASTPPREIGTAQLNGQTGETIYTPKE